MILNGWKEIANYLRCGVRTAQRWERAGLPVNRPIAGERSRVFSASEQLDLWVRTFTPREISDSQVRVESASDVCLVETLRRSLQVIRQLEQSRSVLIHEVNVLRLQLAEREMVGSKPSAEVIHLASGSAKLAS